MAKDISISGHFGTYGFDVDNSGTEESISGIGAYAVNVNYHLFGDFVLVTGFNILVSEVITGSTGYGFDIGGKYYPITSHGYEDFGTETIDVSITEVLRPYVGFAFRQRQFLLSLTSSYVGPGLFMGVDYQAWQNWYLNFEFRYDILFGPNEAEATQMNILFGLGFQI